MTAGRKPTPTALKLIRGNPGKRPVNLDQFNPPVEIPRCPSHLTGEAKKEWKRLSVVLYQAGMISLVDRAAFAIYCTAWARYVEAEEFIQEAKKTTGGNGLFVKTPNGFPVQSPWLAVSNKAMEQVKSFLAEFGMSPASRSRVTPSDNRQLSLLDQPGEGSWNKL